MEDPRRFGVAEAEKLREGMMKVNRLVEKPQKPATNLAIMPVYAFDPVIFEALESIATGFGGELQLTDGIQRMVDWGQKIYRVCGGRRNPIGYRVAGFLLGGAKPIPQILLPTVRLDKRFEQQRILERLGYTKNATKCRMGQGELDTRIQRMLEFFHWAKTHRVELRSLLSTEIIRHSERVGGQRQRYWGYRRP